MEYKSEVNWHLQFYFNGPFPPYPPIGNSSGPKTNSYVGTRVYGWTGCEVPNEIKIAQAYDDMSRIAGFKGPSGTINWKLEAVEEFFGSSE